MQKVLSLLSFYDKLKSSKIDNKKTLDEKKSKILFTQQQILKLCLESKKVIDRMEEKDNI